jgi:hypothetical protein
MITTFYVLVLIRLHHIRRKHQSEMKERSHRKVTRIVLAVITAYFICWVPYWFLQIFITIDPLIHSLRLQFSILPANTSMRFLKELTHLTTIIGYANNCLNPLLYVFLSESFREEYLYVLNCFHPSRICRRNLLPNENIQPREQKTLQNNRKSFILRKRREIAMKKIKHSVAIDDIPLEYQRLAHRFRRSSDHKRYSRASSMLIRINGKDENIIERTSISRQRSVNTKQSNSISFNLVTDLNHLPTTIVDDGGVYCGD